MERIIALFQQTNGELLDSFYSTLSGIEHLEDAELNHAIANIARLVEEIDKRNLIINPLQVEFFLHGIISNAFLNERIAPVAFFKLLNSLEEKSVLAKILISHKNNFDCLKGSTITDLLSNYRQI